MLQAILFAVKDARIRVISVAPVLLGFTYASTIPYQSLIGTWQLGMSERQFGLLIFFIGLAGMVGNLALDYLSDLAKDRKTTLGKLEGAQFINWPLPQISYGVGKSKPPRLCHFF